MPGENVQDWSTTAANNATADSSINWAEGMARAAVNNSSRSGMAAVAKWRDLLNGSITTGGSANAQTFSSGLSFTSVPTGLCVRLKLGFTNTASASLNMDSIGPVTIKDGLGNTLRQNDLVANNYADFRYDGTNWILLTPSIGAIRGTSTNDSAAAGYVGELMESEVLTGSAVSLTNNTAANVTSLSLTAGDWDVWGSVAFNAVAGTANLVVGAINTTSATLPTIPG